jgi:hypothetical protein
MKDPYFSTNDDTYNSIIGSDYGLLPKTILGQGSILYMNHFHPI